MTSGRPSLPRVLTAPAIAILASASMGPAYSIASTMGPMVAAAGDLAPDALALLSLLMLCVAIGFGRMAKDRPDAGSSYGWSEAAFGRHAGAYAAWLLLLSNFFATMATAIPAGIYTLSLVAPAFADSSVAAAAVGTAWIVASAVLLAYGLRPTARASALFLVTELAVLIASAVAVAATTHAPVAAARAAASLPAGGGLGGFAGAMVLGIWMSDGWEVSASASEETTDARASERGGIAGLLVTTAVLLLAMVAYLRLGAGALASHQTNVLDYVADRLGGGAWHVAIAVTVLVSTAATLWTTMLYLSRSVYAMGRSGVLPSALGTLRPDGSPARANVAVACGVGIATLATGLVPSLARALALVLNGTSVFLGLLFALSVAAGARLANARDLRAVAIPLAGGAGLLAVVAVTVRQSDDATRLIDLGGLALGIPFVLWRARR